MIPSPSNSYFEITLKLCLKHIDNGLYIRRSNIVQRNTSGAKTISFIVTSRVIPAHVAA